MRKATPAVLVLLPTRRLPRRTRNGGETNRNERRNIPYRLHLLLISQSKPFPYSKTSCAEMRRPTVPPHQQTNEVRTCSAQPYLTSSPSHPRQTLNKQEIVAPSHLCGITQFPLINFQTWYHCHDDMSFHTIWDCSIVFRSILVPEF